MGCSNIDRGTAVSTRVATAGAKRPTALPHLRTRTGPKPKDGKSHQLTLSRIVLQGLSGPRYGRVPLEERPQRERSPGLYEVDAERHPIAEASRHRTLVEFPEGAGSVEWNPLWPPGHDQETHPHEQHSNGKAKEGRIA